MKKYKPTTSASRGTRIVSYRDKLSKTRPHKPLVSGKRKQRAGRNNVGRITSRYRGGGHKRRFRDIDFKYTKHDIPAVVESLEYDPYRSGFIARVCYRDGERQYVLAPHSLSVGDEIITSEQANIRPGNRMPLSRVPVGSMVYNVETQPDAGAKLVRSAGSQAEVIAHEGGYTHLKMPSTEVRKIPSAGWASIGAVSNPEHKLTVSGKAGRTRWKGRRPRVRGFAMAAVDHPYGGGEGKTGVGHRRLRTKWGKPAGKGQRTRNTKKYSRNLIVRPRRRGKKRK